MFSNELFTRINNDFKKVIFSEVWNENDLNSIYDKNSNDYSKFNLNYDFYKSGSGVFLDNTSVINRVFITVFPEEDLIENICKYNEKALILTRHPFLWSLSENFSKEKFYVKPISVESMDKLKSKNISIYVLHNGLEENNEYSATHCFLQGLKMKFIEDFTINNKKIAIAEYTNDSIEDLLKFIEKRINHNIKFYDYANSKLLNSKRVAITSGIMFEEEALDYLKEKNVNTLISGVTAKLKSFFNSVNFHLKAEKYEINIIGTTHYSSEKWASMNLLDYFRKIGLSSVYLPGKYDLNDL